MSNAGQRVADILNQLEAEEISVDAIGDEGWFKVHHADVTWYLVPTYDWDSDVYSWVVQDGNP